jgi:hypothetical protein
MASSTSRPVIKAWSRLFHVTHPDLRFANAVEAEEWLKDNDLRGNVQGA